MRPSVPRPNRSMRPLPQDTDAGLDTMAGPSDSHPFQRAPSHQPCQMALSLPRTNRSRRLADQDETAGPESAGIPGGGAPNSLNQLDHFGAIKNRLLAVFQCVTR